MAKRSDAISREEPKTSRIAHVGRGHVDAYNNSPRSVYRYRGRRGVRARRRAYRIAERQYNGTYRQPTGGTITNS